jgi:hypothetical protein
LAGGVVIASLGALTWPLTGCGSCAASCEPPLSQVLQTSGYLVVAVQSSCDNAHTPVPGSAAFGAALEKKATCHFDITLDDGEVVSLDVPFTKDVQECCCGGCTTVEAADFTPLTITAPPGYVPVTDAGADAPDDGAPDAALE